MGVGDILAKRRVLICVGSGGVGKTTTSAALALEAAIRGRHALCLTIDPARRLATSLGLSDLRADEQSIPPALFAHYGLKPEGSLAAMMLNTQRTFEELVRKHASSPEARDRILENRMYQYVSRSLAGTQEYMAMEKLHAVRSDPRWDFIVLDTPPTSNALDFLDAPERLIEAIDSAAMRWFIQAFEDSGRLSLQVVGRGAAFVFRGLAKLTGTEFLEQVAEFVSGLNDLFGGFRERARAVSATLRSPDVGFVVVTSPTALAIAEAVAFERRLRDAGMTSDAFVVNGVHRASAAPFCTPQDLARALEQAVPSNADRERLAARMLRAHADESLLAACDRRELKRLRDEIGARSLFLEVPAFDEDIHDLGALARVGAYLTAPTRSPSAVD